MQFRLQVAGNVLDHADCLHEAVFAIGLPRSAALLSHSFGNQLKLIEPVLDVKFHDFKLVSVLCLLRLYKPEHFGFVTFNLLKPLFKVS